MKNKIFTLLLLLVGLVFFGCQTTTTYYLGAKADEKGVISLAAAQAGPQQWQDLYVTVDYSLHRQGNRFSIDGALSFSDHPKGMYTRVPDLKLKLFFLNKDMRVVDYLDVARTLSTSLDDKTPFSRTLDLKDDVVSFTFGYEGEFIDADPEMPTRERVWKLPKREL